MDFRFTPEQEEFHKEFTSWVEKNLPEDWGQTGLRYFKTEEDQKQGSRESHQLPLSSAIGPAARPSAISGRRLNIISLIVSRASARPSVGQRS